MEPLILPSSPPMDFEFGFGSSPINCLSAPSSPMRRSGGPCFLSAPTSPTRISEFYRQYEDFSISMMEEMSSSHMTPNSNCSVSASSVPFSWEEKPGTPKKNRTPKKNDDHDHDHDFDFAFDVKVESSDMGSPEDLFSGGKIRPLKLLESDETSQRTPLIQSPRSPKSKKLLMEAFQEQIKKQSDPFQEQVKKQSKKQEKAASPAPASLTSSSSSSSSSGSRRWRFKDFLLFRSASEGRGSDKDPLRKYVKRQERDKSVNGGSFRSEMAVSSRRFRSAHEKHYVANKAAAEDVKKRTFLPYRQGILGRLAFMPMAFGL